MIMFLLVPFIVTSLVAIAYLGDDDDDDDDEGNSDDE